MLIQLGDAGLNYYLDERDLKKKEELQQAIDRLKEKGVNAQVLFVRGNHESRLCHVEKYAEKITYGGWAYVEEAFPDLVFLKDGEQYIIGERRFFVVGGGYSKDFFERLLRGYGYWYDEQLSDEEFQRITEKAGRIDEDIYVLSHMLPLRWSPEQWISEQWVSDEKRAFEQARRTEMWLEKIAELLGNHLKRWYAGHYHMDFSGEHYEMLYQDIKRLE